MTVSAHEPTVASPVTWQHALVSRGQRQELTAQRGATVWLTGLPAAGKSTLAYAAEARLIELGRTAYVLDGDNLRHRLNRDLGFEPAARAENVRRTAEVAALLCDAGIVTIVSLVSPYAADRRRARALHIADRLPFIEVYVATSLPECERRDPKGLYRRARRGDLLGFTGIDAPYEPPQKPELIVGRRGESLSGSLEPVLAAILAITEPSGRKSERQRGHSAQPSNHFPDAR